jgi:hypothetical protein
MISLRLVAVAMLVVAAGVPSRGPCQESEGSDSRLLWQAENPSCFDPDADLEEKLESASQFVVGGEITEPKKISGRSWSCEDLARLATRKEQTRPVIEVVVGTHGSVELVAAVREEVSEADELFAAVVSDWKYESATLNGRPICVRYILTSTISY